MRIEEIIKLVDAGYSKAEIADLMRDNKNNEGPADPASADPASADPAPADPAPADPTPEIPESIQKSIDSIGDALTELSKKINDINLFNTDFENTPKSDEDILAEIIAPKLIERK